ncbi:MAG: aminoglycoside phosphotransferase family protein [Actinomycetota bacterium]|nr:aminoglycoside phosphotransferase family protein [Actinomycetota bacterium]
MNTTDVAGLLPPLLASAGLPDGPQREPLRVWAHSAVERLHFVGGASVVFKYADTPFDTEDVALRLAASHGVPVPALRAARTIPGMLGMLLEDLGEPVRDADDRDGARAAVHLHRVTAAAPGMTRLDSAAMASLPRRITNRLQCLGLVDLAKKARALDAVATNRADGAELRPFGLCHSEFHPTSLHISVSGWRLLDFARAFIGPGLLDLASWHGTLDNPQPERTLELIESYVAGGGSQQALAMRGGLDAASWALGWHRIWIVDWFAEQIERGWAQEAEHTWTTAIGRHLGEACTLLKM